MKTITRNTALALAGMLALTVYILACTAFSPDDTKVLYPAFDLETKTVGMAVYDRETRRSEMLFLPVTYEKGESNAVPANFLRGQWLANGRQVVMAWTGANDSDDTMNVAVVPWAGRAPVRVFRIPDVKQSGSVFMVPLCIAGERLFFATESKTIIRVNLRTGALGGHQVPEVDKDLSVYPAPDGEGLFYVQSKSQPENATVFGRMNPETFERTPLTVITNELADRSFFTYDKEGKMVAFIGKGNGTNRLVVLREGKMIFTRPLDSGDVERNFGSAGFSSRSNLVWATYRLKAKDKPEATFGFIEIPLSDAPVRETPLITGVTAHDEADVLYFQGSVSHDGKTAAVASTYLALAEKDYKPEDCALFLIDLSDPNRRVTKVPIPFPAKDNTSTGK